MNYNEKAKELNTLLRIFDSTIMALSVGVISFSLTNYKSTEANHFIGLLYFSWTFLSISFFMGMVRFHHLIKIMGRNTVEQFNVEVKKLKVEINEARIKATNKKSAWLYRIMLTSFCLGVLLYFTFKVFNLN